MAALLIKDLPPEIHAWLKKEAEQHRRSLTQEAIVIFEDRMRGPRPLPYTKPIKLDRPLTSEFIERAIKEGRA